MTRVKQIFHNLKSPTEHQISLMHGISNQLGQAHSCHGGHKVLKCLMVCGLGMHNEVPRNHQSGGPQINIRPPSATLAGTLMGRSGRGYTNRSPTLYHPSSIRWRQSKLGDCHTRHQVSATSFPRSPQWPPWPSSFGCCCCSTIHSESNPG